MQLAIDTSTNIASLALIKDNLILTEMTWHCGQNHTVELYPRLDFLLQKSGMDIESADCVFVARGPGSFNGLRVGVSAAKGLAFSLGIPIIGISTLETTAYQHAETGLPVYTVQNAGREEIAVAGYQKKIRKGWCQLAPEHLTTVNVLASEIKEKTVFCGEFDEATSARIKKLLKSKALISTTAGQLRRAAYLAELGLLRKAVGDFDNVATLQPLYLRRPPITERKKA
jgi:tRNA threonylcarbamoyl adenosine modification protein YeaZ